MGLVQKNLHQSGLKKAYNLTTLEVVVKLKFIIFQISNKSLKTHEE